VQTDINRCKIKNCKRGYKTEFTGRSPLRRRRSAPDFRANWEKRGEYEEVHNDVATNCSSNGDHYMLSHAFRQFGANMVCMQRANHPDVSLHLSKVTCFAV
jgi:hypothetical protein